jgi:hypothetical protein
MAQASIGLSAFSTEVWLEILGDSAKWRNSRRYLSPPDAKKRHISEFSEFGIHNFGDGKSQLLLLPSEHRTMIARLQASLFCHAGQTAFQWKWHLLDCCHLDRRHQRSTLSAAKNLRG